MKYHTESDYLSLSELIELCGSDSDTDNLFEEKKCCQHSSREEDREFQRKAESAVLRSFAALILAFEAFNEFFEGINRESESR